MSWHVYFGTTGAAVSTFQFSMATFRQVRDAIEIMETDAERLDDADRRIKTTKNFLDLANRYMVDRGDDHDHCLRQREALDTLISELESAARNGRDLQDKAVLQRFLHTLWRGRQDRKKLDRIFGRLNSSRAELALSSQSALLNLGASHKALSEQLQGENIGRAKRIGEQCTQINMLEGRVIRELGNVEDQLRVVRDGVNQTLDKVSDVLSRVSVHVDNGEVKGMLEDAIMLLREQQGHPQGSDHASGRRESMEFE